MAEDLTGPERPAVFARGLDFPTVVDRQNALGRLLDFDVVPNGVLLDAEGRIAFMHVGGFDLRRDDVRARVEGLLDELAERAPPGSAPDLPQRAPALETLLADVAWPASAQPRIFVCGPTRLVEAVATDCLTLGHEPARIKTERFGPTGA